MNTTIIILILILITVSSLAITIYCVNNKIREDAVTKEINNALHSTNKRLEQECLELSNLKNKTQTDFNLLEEKIKMKSEEIQTLEEHMKIAAEASLSTQKELSRIAFENWWEVLENQYKETEEEYSELSNNLHEAYSSEQNRLKAETDLIRDKLDAMRATRAAALEAQRREKEIKEKASFYCIQQSPEDLDDIARLERIKPSLNKPRVLSMLIWSTFWQKPLKTLSVNVLGTSNPVCGIYKITNQQTDQCYIGQAKDVAKRWSEHAKCGLGIDTPMGNKLYAAIQEYGLQSFSFELLEALPAEQLDEKEQYYISLYDSVSFGYNILKGVNLKK